MGAKPYTTWDYFPLIKHIRGEIRTESQRGFHRQKLLTKHIRGK